MRVLIEILMVVIMASSVRGAEVPTNCNTMLHNFFVALGMPALTPVQQAITLTPGTLMGVPYVTATDNIQAVAIAYANLLPNITLANLTRRVYTTLDNPWCVAEYGFNCINNISVGTAKTTNCTTITDFDMGGSNPVAGRFFIYHNQSSPCNGASTITFYNTTIISGEDGTWTFDAVGIRDHIEMNYAQSRNSYRTSKCLFTDGNPADMIDQNQFVCIMPRIGCNATRTAGVPNLDIIPLPQFRCIGKLSPNWTSSIMWNVVNLQPPTGVEGEFVIGFLVNLAFASSLQTQLLIARDFKVSVPNTRRQFDSHYNSFSHYSTLFAGGRWINYQPVYPYSQDPLLMAVPCVCEFSMDCLVPNEADLTNYATFQLSLDNAPPICNPGPALSIPLHYPNFTLNASLSYDPDNGPGGFYNQWAIYSTPYSPGPPPFTLIDPSAREITIDSSNLTSGNYFFILWVSDQQDIPVCVWNLTIRENEFVAIIYPSQFIQTFDFFAGNVVGHECAIYPPSPSITLNGTLSYSTDFSTNLYYYWVQTSGPPLAYLCDDIGFFTTRAFFNTNQAVADFVPSGVGYYCFQLFVGDNISNSTAALACVQVNPDFGQAPSTFTPIINYTDPPLRNLTPPTRPEITFPPTTNAPFNTFPPISSTPTANIVPPPFIPIQPNITNAEVLIVYTIISAWILIIAFMIIIWHSYGNARWTGFMQRKDWMKDSTF